MTSRDVPLHLTVVPATHPAGTVVFVPGIAGNARVYSSCVPGSDLFAAFAGDGLNVVAVDLQGHGLSGGRRGHLPFRGALENIEEAVGYAAERFGEPVGLAGTSLGGILSLYAGIEDDRVVAVLCHNTIDLRDISPLGRRIRQRLLIASTGMIRSSAAWAPLVRAPVRMLISPGDVFEDPENVRRWRRTPGTVWWYTLESVASIFFTPEDKPAVEALDKPLLVATGDEDPIFPVAAQRSVVERVEGPAELWVLEGAGHGVPLEHLRAFGPRAGEWFRKAFG